MLNWPHKLTVFGISGTVRIDGDASRATVRVSGASPLGRSLGADKHRRTVAATYIRQDMGWPRGIGATPITFVFTED